MLEHLLYFGEISYSSEHKVVPSLMLFTVVVTTHFNVSEYKVMKTKYSNHSLIMGLITTMLSFMYQNYVSAKQKSAVFA